MEKRGISDIKRENFSFSTKILIGDFLRPSGETDDSGEEKYLRLSEEAMKDEIDKVRKENGWKPRKRIGPSHSRDGGRKSTSSDRSDSMKKEDQYKLLQRLQVHTGRKYQEIASSKNILPLKIISTSFRRLKLWRENGSGMIKNKLNFKRRQ